MANFLVLLLLQLIDLIIRIFLLYKLIFNRWASFLNAFKSLIVH